MDEVVIGFSSRAWAECAIGDLALEGCRGELLPEQGAQGAWLVRVSGPQCKIAEVRYAACGPEVRVDWEAFVNAALAPPGG